MYIKHKAAQKLPKGETNGLDLSSLKINLCKMAVVKYMQELEVSFTVI